MKRTNLITLLTCILIAVVAVVAIRYPRTVPYEQCSEVYKRYSSVEGVRATYVKDYRINDTLTIGVTLLEATTDSGWAMLQEDFGLPVIPKEYEERFVGDSNKVSTKIVPKESPLVDGEDSLVHDIIAISRYKHIIAHFELQSKVQESSLLDKLINDNMIIKSYEQVD